LEGIVKEKGTGGSKKAMFSQAADTVIPKKKKDQQPFGPAPEKKGGKERGGIDPETNGSPNCW